jgi:hypothetical protein
VPAIRVFRSVSLDELTGLLSVRVLILHRDDRIEVEFTFDGIATQNMVKVGDRLWVTQGDDNAHHAGFHVDLVQYDGLQELTKVAATGMLVGGQKTGRLPFLTPGLLAETPPRFASTAEADAWLEEQARRREALQSG